MIRTTLLGGSGIEVSRVCLGTWNMSRMAGWGPADDKQAVRLIQYAVDGGCTFIDTARAYGGGHAEKLVGQALRGRRDRVVIATKMFHCLPAEVAPQLEESLRCLETDRIDLYYCHWPRPSLALEPFLEALCRERDAGRIRAIGVSNFDLAQMQLAARFGAVVLQPPLSVLWSIPEPVMAFCRDHAISLAAYSPLAQGLLTGRYRNGVAGITGVRGSNMLFSERLAPHALRVAGLVDDLARRLGCTSSQVALAWLLQTPGVASVIVGASRVEQWDENLGCLGVTLPAADYERLDREGRGVWEMLGPEATMWNWRPS
jgi:aryl-alcohol dehydrogenase-like predicted oxidoreductase